MIKNRQILTVSGIDAEAFLQQLVTNDVKNIGDGLQYNLLLSPQGKLLHDFFILKVAENHYWLDCHEPAIDDILAIFNKYKLGSQVEFSINNGIFVTSSPDGYQDPRHKDLPFRSYKSNEIDNFNDINIHYELCLPRLYIDFDSGKYFPFEVGFDNFNAISYTKGCYVGQEVITRTHHRGIVRKKVYKVHSNSQLKHNSELYLDDRKVGVILGVYGNKALALLNSELISDSINLTNEDGNQVIISL